MKPKLEQVLINSHTHSFLCFILNVPAFEFFWHYHPEYELTYIVKGKGKRLVGDSYENFADGDLLLLGPQLPHTWASDKKGKYTQTAVVIQFTPAFIDPFLNYPEFADIKKLLSKSVTGLQCTGIKNKPGADKFLSLSKMQGAEAITGLIQLLHTLTKCSMKTIASGLFQPLKGKENELRINSVFQYVQKHYRSRLSVKQAASFIHLSESAFCKFFKRACGKTFSVYVNDIRVAHACGLLIETDKSISAIAFACGFESLTYFNRIFLRNKNITPGKFRKISAS